MRFLQVIVVVVEESVQYNNRVSKRSVKGNPIDAYVCYDVNSDRTGNVMIKSVITYTEYYVQRIPLTYSGLFVENFSVLDSILSSIINSCLYVYQ